MALDRQSIEKRDFPVGRRGYDPDAVDAHLAAVADEVDTLRRSARARTDTLASTASEQVRAIVQAAETSAADIQREAQAEAREIRDEANAEAKATRTQATDRARDYVGQISESSEAMLTRLESMQAELDALLGSLRTGAGRLSSELKTLQSDLNDTRDAITPHSGFEPEPAQGRSATDPDTESASEPVAAERPAAGPGVPELVDGEVTPVAAGSASDEGDVAPASSEEDIEGARLIALNMALNGTAREETARYLRETFGLSDSSGLLDEVYASVGG